MNRATLLLLTLGLSLAFMPWGCSAKPSSQQSKTTAEKEQDRAIAEIEKICGKVTIDKNSPGNPVIEVALVQLRSIDAGLANVKGMTQLRVLNLLCSGFTDAGLANLEGLTKLQSLILESTNITDSELEHLKGLTQLQSLDLLAVQCILALLDAIADQAHGHGIDCLLPAPSHSVAAPTCTPVLLAPLFCQDNKNIGQRRYEPHLNKAPMPS
jgi:hypothetical protein